VSILEKIDSSSLGGSMLHQLFLRETQKGRPDVFDNLSGTHPRVFLLSLEQEIVSANDRRERR